MLFTYTAEEFGTIIASNFSGKYNTETIKSETHTIYISERLSDGLLWIKVLEGKKLIKLISNKELIIKEHPTDNYSYPLLKNE